MDCEGYRKLLTEVERDEAASKTHDYRGKLAWVLARVQHYAEKTGLPASAILDAWEKRRDYWYMNYYQESQQPLIQNGRVRVFDTAADLTAAIGSKFRCPSCGGVSISPYECEVAPHQVRTVPCDWKVYGLFHDLGKGVYVFVKELVRGELIFMPCDWEKES